MIVGLLVLTIADGVLTIELLDISGEELNPFMAHLLDRGRLAFLAGKYILTAAGLPFLVVFKNYRLFGTRFRVGYLFPVFIGLYIVLARLPVEHARMGISHHAVLALLCLVIGGALGSFLNVCVYRIPRGLSLLRPRSRCPRCGATIARCRQSARSGLALAGWSLPGMRRGDLAAVPSGRAGHRGFVRGRLSELRGLAHPSTSGNKPARSVSSSGCWRCGR